MHKLTPGSIPGAFYVEWIEGIGSVTGPPHLHQLADGYLDCVYQDTLHVYDGSDFSGIADSVCDCYFLNVLAVGYESQLSMVPNPTKERWPPG